MSMAVLVAAATVQLAMGPQPDAPWPSPNPGVLYPMDGTPGHLTETDHHNANHWANHDDWLRAVAAGRKAFDRRKDGRLDGRDWVALDATGRERLAGWALGVSNLSGVDSSGLRGTTRLDAADRKKAHALVAVGDRFYRDPAKRARALFDALGLEIDRTWLPDMYGFHDQPAFALAPRALIAAWQKRMRGMPGVAAFDFMPPAGYTNGSTQDDPPYTTYRLSVLSEQGLDLLYRQKGWSTTDGNMDHVFDQMNRGAHGSLYTRPDKPVSEMVEVSGDWGDPIYRRWTRAMVLALFETLSPRLDEAGAAALLDKDLKVDGGQGEREARLGTAYVRLEREDAMVRVTVRPAAESRFLARENRIKLLQQLMEKSASPAP